MNLLCTNLVRWADGKQLVFAPQKYSMTPFTSDTPQSWLHQQLQIGDEVTPWNRTPKSLGVKLDIHFTFGPHVRNGVERALSAFNAVIKALAGSSWNFTTETCLVTTKETCFGFTTYFMTETYQGDREKCADTLVQTLNLVFPPYTLSPLFT